MKPSQPPPVNESAGTGRRRRPELLTFPLPAIPPPPLPSSSTEFQPSELKRVRLIGCAARGISSVYEVLHRPTGKIYALKVFYGFYEMRRQFEILRDVENPNAVQCHGVIHHNDDVRLLLEYMDKGNLSGTHISHEPYLSELAAGILRGLSELHRLRIIHRGIKPSNLLINSEGAVKIADFSVSATLERIDESALDYLCPERISTDFVHGACDGSAGDIWSLGICILEFYLGKSPFSVAKEGGWATLLQTIYFSEPPVAPDSASQEFRSFIGCCLQKNPTMRWTAAQLLEHPFIAPESCQLQH